MAEAFATRTIAAIAEGAIRDDAGAEVPLSETAWALARMTDESLARLRVFLADLTHRAPLSGVAWSAHRMVIEALEADIGREVERRG